MTILEKLVGSGRTERGAIDPKVKAERKKKETKWILKLRTVYPYGLNDRINDEFKRTQERKRINNLFPPLPRNRVRVARGQNRTGTPSFSAPSFITILDKYLRSNLQDAMNFIRISLTTKVILNKPMSFCLTPLVNLQNLNFDNGIQLDWISLNQNCTKRKN